MTESNHDELHDQFNELLKISGGGCGCAVSEFVPNQVNGGGHTDELTGGAAKKRTSKKRPSTKKKASKAGSKKKSSKKKAPSRKKSSRRKKGSMDGL
jgi:hypothetical protein